MQYNQACVCQAKLRLTLPPSKTPVGVLLWTCRSEGNDRADRLAGKATVICGLRLGRSEVLRSLRHYVRTQSRQGHHTVDRLEERGGVDRGSVRRSSFKGRRGHCQSEEHWNWFKGNSGETSEGLGGAHMGFSGLLDTMLNCRTELNCDILVGHLGNEVFFFSLV